MQADRVDLAGDFLARRGHDRTLAQHRLDPRADLFGVMQNRTGFRARHQRSVILIGAIGENLARPIGLQVARDLLHRGLRQHDEDDLGLHLQRRGIAGAGNLGILRGHVRQRPVQLEMPHRAARRTGHRLRRAQLIGHQIGQFLGAEVEATASEALQVG